MSFDPSAIHCSTDLLSKSFGMKKARSKFAWYYPFRMRAADHRLPHILVKQGMCSKFKTTGKIRLFA
jgi:hypothetical protein